MRAVAVLVLFAILAVAGVVVYQHTTADDLACPAGQHQVLVPGGHRCDVGAVVRGEVP